MSAKNTVAVVLAAGLLYYGFTRKKLLDSVTFAFKKISFEGSIVNPRLIVYVTATNPTKFVSTIKSIYGTIYLNDTVKIGDVSFDAPTTIKEQGVTDLKIPIDVVYTGIVETIKNLIAKKSGRYTFDGWVTVDGISLPVKQSQNFG